MSEGCPRGRGLVCLVEPDMRLLHVFQMAGPQGCSPDLGYSSLDPVSALWTEHSHCVGCEEGLWRTEPKREVLAGLEGS